MAFVSDEHRLVFLHLTKNGGTSITDALLRMHGCDLQAAETNKHRPIGLDFPAQFRPNGIDIHDPWREIVRKYPKAKRYRTLAVVRNPWERIFSFYQHKKRRGDADLPAGSFSEIIRTSNVLLLHPQNWWLEGAPGLLEIDFEYMADGWGRVAESFGLPYVPLQHLNRTTKPADYREHYDEEAREAVREHYRWEIERYGFLF